MGELQVPDTATAIRLVRPVGDDLREYQAMETEAGAAGIRRTLHALFVRPVPVDVSYGLADLLDDNGDIVGEIPLDRRDFQYVKRKLKCRVVPTEADTASSEGEKDA